MAGPQSLEQFTSRLADLGSTMAELMAEHSRLLSYAQELTSQQLHIVTQAEAGQEATATAITPVDADHTAEMAVQLVDDLQPGLILHQAGTFDKDRDDASAFVVNVGTLVDAMEVLGILHEFVKSTAIAAMTLVTAGSTQQMGNSVLFLLLVFLVYRRHEKRFDRLDTSDIQAQVALYPSEGMRYNPASVFTSLTMVHTHMPVWMFFTFCTSLMSMFWVVVFYAHLHPTSWSEPESGHILTPLIVSFIKSEEDLEAMGMQWLILTVMFGFHFIFVFLHEYHTGWAFGPAPDGSVWDLESHGVPPWCRLLGLPAMWFSTRQGKQRLLEHIQHAQHEFGINGIAPEELALLALNGDGELRELLAVALQGHEYVQKDRVGKDAELVRHRLCLELRFYFEHLVGSNGRVGIFLTVSPDESSPDGALESVIVSERPRAAQAKRRQAPQAGAKGRQPQAHAEATEALLSQQGGNQERSDISVNCDGHTTQRRAHRL